MQRPIVIMVVDPDPLSAERVLEAAQDYVSEVVAYASMELMLTALPENFHVDVIVLNLERPFEWAFDLPPRLKSKLPRVEVVFVTRFDDETLWVEAIQRGAMICFQNLSTSPNYHESSFLQSKSIAGQ